MVVIKNIIKRRVSERGNVVLDNLNFLIRKNEYVEIIAEDREAADTLVKVLALIERDYEGEYFFGGALVNRLSEKEATKLRSKSIGLVKGELNLINELTIEENLELPFLYKKSRFGVQRSIIDCLLEKFNLQHRRGHYPVSLSSFTRLKAAIAQAIVLNPQLLILEYDFSTLSSEDRLELANLLYSLNEDGLTILVITDMESTTSLAYRRLRMKDGKMFPV